MAAYPSDNRLLVLNKAPATRKTSEFTLTRYTAKGAVDTTFGRNGSVYVDVGENFTLTTSMQMRVLSSGQIVVAGQLGTLYDLFIMKLTPAGVPDTTFGTGGHLRIDVEGDNERLHDLLVQSDGKFVLIGEARGGATNDYDCMAVRVTNAGALDSSFAQGGKFLYNFGQYDESCYSAVQMPADSSIIIGGQSAKLDGTGGVILPLLKLTSTGALDTTWGGTGRVNIDPKTFPNGIGTVYPWLAVQAGRLIVAATLLNSANGTIPIGGGQTMPAGDVLVMRFTSTGQLDTGFGGAHTGYWTKDFGTHELVGGLAVAQSSDIVVVGDSSALTANAPFVQMAVHLDPSGKLDTISGNHGLVLNSGAGGTTSTSGVLAMNFNSLCTFGTAGTSGPYSTASDFIACYVLRAAAIP